MEKSSFNNASYLKIISNEKEFYELRYAWNDLLKVSSVDNIFLTWEWVYNWWRIFNDGRKLNIITFWKENEIIGIAPLLIRKNKYFGLLKYNKIEFLASGEDEADEICSEYLNVIIKPVMEEQVIGELINYLCNSNDWDEVVLKELVVGNKNTTILLARLKAGGLKYTVDQDDAAPYIELPASWEDLLSILNSEFRYKIRRDRRKLSEKGIVEITEVNEADELGPAFDILVSLHQIRWKKIGKKGCFNSHKFYEFHKKMINRLFNLKQLRLLILKVNKKPVAVLYEFIYNAKILYYQSGFDIDYDPKLSIGNILRAYSIEKAISERYKEYDFLKGTDKRHCREWSNNERKIIKIKIYKKSLKELIYSFIIALKNKLTIRKLGNNKQHKVITCEKSET